MSTNPSGYAAGLTSGGPCALTNSDEPLPPPPKKSYCYSYMAKQNSSKRTRAGAMASIVDAKSLTKKARKRRNKRAVEKEERIKSSLMHIKPQPPNQNHRFAEEHFTKNIIVFDGGQGTNPPISPPPRVNWTSIRISESTMLQPECTPGKGLIYLAHDSPKDEPVFVLAPREMALDITGLGSHSKSKLLSEAFSSAIKKTRALETRGGSRTIFTDRKVAHLGTQACRNRKGLRTSYHKDVMVPEHWDTIVDFVRASEKVFMAIMPTNVIRHTMSSKELLGYPTMTSNSGRESEQSQIFSAITIGHNAILQLHMDDDHTYSIATVLQEDHHCKRQDDILGYMCFPRQGIAVPLRTGDTFIFNPREPHCISSRCDNADSIFCISIYLKTAVVGMNNNSLEITARQESVSSKYLK